MSEKFKQGHALIIGAGADLQNTITDATGLSEIFKDPERCSYPSDQVNLLTGENATRDTILEGLKKLSENTTIESTIVFYFSGHGYQVDTPIGKAYYIMPFGYDINRLYQTAVSGNELTDCFRKIPAQKMLILLDCCHAGGLDDIKSPGLQLVKAPLPKEALSLLIQGSGRVIIASSMAGELSYAGRPYSAFTLALVEALNGKGASKQDGYVRVADLALYASQMVPKRTQNKQHPILNFEHADNFIIAYYAGGEPEAKSLPFTDEDVKIEPTPGSSIFNQSSQTIYGSQTNIAGNVDGPIFSGTFQGPVRVGGKETIDTRGGAYIKGNVKVGGDFVGRDKIVQGNEITEYNNMGDRITVGNISGQGIAIGRSAQSTVNMGISGKELTSLFEPLIKSIQDSPKSNQTEALKKVEELKQEVEKGKSSDDSRMGKLIDGVIALVPGAVSSLVSIFGTPILGGIVGPVTKFVLDKIKGN
jgi:hypothetical protein